MVIALHCDHARTMGRHNEDHFARSHVEHGVHMRNTSMRLASHNGSTGDRAAASRIRSHSDSVVRYSRDRPTRSQANSGTEKNGTVKFRLLYFARHDYCTLQGTDKPKRVKKGSAVLVDVDSKTLEVPYDGIPDFNEKVREMYPPAKQMDMTVLQRYGYVFGSAEVNQKLRDAIEADWRKHRTFAEFMKDVKTSSVEDAVTQKKTLKEYLSQCLRSSIERPEVCLGLGTDGGSLRRDGSFRGEIVQLFC